MGFFKNLLFPDFCIYCKSVGSPICSNCLENFEPYYYRKANSSFIALYHYNSPASFLLKKAKYRSNKHILEYFLQIISLSILNKTREEFRKLENPLLLFVPDSKQDRRVRGYSQTELLANYLAKIFALTTKDWLLQVGMKPRRQSMFKSHRDRWQNVKGVYGLKPSIVIKNRDFVLIDDVVTSGATTKTITKLLLQKKVRRVMVWSLFRSY